MKKGVCMLLAVVMMFSLLLANNSPKVSAEADQVQKILDLNFEDGSVAGWTAHDDSVWNQQDYNHFKVYTDRQDSTNQVLELCHYGTTGNYQVQHELMASVSKAVLEYRFYLYPWSGTHASFLPGLLYEQTESSDEKANAAPFGLYIRDVNGYDEGVTLFYNYGRGITREQIKLTDLVHSRWYTMRIEYDLPNKTVDVYLDGTKLELPTQGLTVTSDGIHAQAKLDRVSLGTAPKTHTWSCYDDIVVTTTDESVTPSDATRYFVTVNGNGAKIADGYAIAGTKGEDYTLTVAPVPGYTYTVTATVGGETAEVVKEGNTYTVAAVSDKLAFTVTGKVNTDKVSVHRYLTLQDANMWLVLQGEELGSANRPTYDGKTMFYSPGYEAYAYLVIAENLTEEDAKARIGVESGKAATIDYSYDIDLSGQEDVSDAQYIYNMYNAVYTGITESETMKRYFLADANGDKSISVKDALAVCEGIKDYDPAALKTEGKVCATFGDSITWYDGQVYNSGKEQGAVAYGYQRYMLSDLHFSSVLNYGYSGAPMPYIVEEVLQKITDESAWYDIDYMTIMSGANDERLGTPLGAVAPKGSRFDMTTYIGALQSGIEFAFAKNPDIKIVLFTPIKGWIYAPLGYGANNVQIEDGVVTEKWADAVKEVAKLYDLPVCDLYNDSGIDYEIADREAYMNDPEPPENMHYSLHPNTAGYRLMGEQIVKTFKDLQ